MMLNIDQLFNRMFAFVALWNKAACFVGLKSDLKQ